MILPDITDTPGADPRWHVLVLFLASILAAGALTVSIIKRSTHREIDFASLFSLLPMAGILTLILAGLPFFVFGALGKDALNYRAIFSVVMIVLAAGVPLLNLRMSKPESGSLPSLVTLILLLCGLAVLRLYFIRDLVMPPYSDSVEHYQIISDLLHPEKSPQAFYSLARLTSHYYHFGFHVLAGLESALFALPIQETMLVLGQVLQAVIPISLFFPVKSATGSNLAGLAAVVLAGFGWSMPAFASNWGKYPALTSLAVLPFVLGMLVLAESTPDRREKNLWMALAVIGGILVVFSHTRSLLLLAAAMAGWWLAEGISKKRAGWKISLVLLAALAAWVLYRILSDDSVLFMAAPYVLEGFFPTALVILLIPFGIKAYPRPMLAMLFFLLLLMAGALVSLPGEEGPLVFLDRPFVQMTLFLPLALIGALGLAGLAMGMDRSRLKEKYPKFLSRLWSFTLLLLAAAIGFNAYRSQDILASSCCQLASADDIAAYQWIRENLPGDAVILIASNRTPSRRVGVDGGMWITPITGYRTEKWPYNAPMNSPEVLKELCDKGITHIYAGGTSSRFSVETMESRTAWYQDLFVRPRAYVYQIIGCPGRAD